MRKEQTIEERMKEYENVESNRRAMKFLPVMVRLDGRSFHRWTKELNAPFDYHLSKIFTEVAFKLMKDTGANVAYTQSDEISLCWYAPEINSQIFFDGRYQKLASVLASMTTYYFNSMVPELLSAKNGVPAFFDCRVWQLPNISEATNCFVWRYLDAQRNAIQMVGQVYFSPKQLFGKSCDQIEQMLADKKVNMNDYKYGSRFGTFYIKVRKNLKLTDLTQAQFAALPAEHELRKDPDKAVEFVEFVERSIPNFHLAKNKIEMLFEGQEPIFEDVDGTNIQTG